MKTCAHHWDIAPANGPTSAGICRKCGDSKEFVNHSYVSYVKKPTGQLAFHITNRVNAAIAEDIRMAEGLTYDHTRTW